MKSARGSWSVAQHIGGAIVGASALLALVGLGTLVARYVRKCKQGVAASPVAEPAEARTESSSNATPAALRCGFKYEG